MMPSKLDVDEHYASNHVPYRSWCKHCVMGRCVNTGHRKQNLKEEDALVTISMDYGYMTEVKEEDEEKEDKDGVMPVMFTVNNQTGYLTADVVPAKGVNPFAVKRMSEVLNS